MIRVVSAWKIGDPKGVEFDHGWTGIPVRFFDEKAAKNAAEQINGAIGASTGYLRPMLCFLLEVQGDRGKPSYFDLGSPVEVEGG